MLPPVLAESASDLWILKVVCSPVPAGETGEKKVKVTWSHRVRTADYVTVESSTVADLCSRMYLLKPQMHKKTYSCV